MPTNDFKAFATGGSATVLTQTAYVTLASLIANGFQNGVADPAQVNKVLRQGANMAAMLGQFITDQAGVDALDDGNIATLEAAFLTAVRKASARSLSGYVSANYTPTSGSSVTRSLTFTAPCAGIILGMASSNNSNIQSASIQNTLTINDSMISQDHTILSMCNHGSQAVASGTSCTVSQNTTADVTGASYFPLTMWLSYLFVPSF